MQLPYFEVAKIRVGEPDEPCFQHKNYVEAKTMEIRLSQMNPTDSFMTMQVGFGEVINGTIF